MITSEKKTKKNEIVVSIVSGLLTIVYGVIFSLITHFNSETSHLVIKLAVWIVGIYFCIILVIGILRIFKIKFNALNYKFIFILTSLISATLAVIIAGTFELEYFVTLIAIVGLYELFKKIIKINNKHGE
ncbi:MAG: hypothetical protein A2Y45_01500 [Tenericutes bacterium GWC2_34_14]|nr:MAG: hypothetical protein A2Z84_04725 [Tenericutes bacterium GWA2_35_7]OHE28214.1 MAG: hypothetical protein A2Y45_01500 [Tenericutes bacterium GWC2_34_14]OHE33160.1 MAG: hypothetical protein A2012_00580 [Tenericutes bacterium GWE2_34_108]OHE36280.1 MAG: hypothetical protein A2Y46_07570 [Tenericutes bacterium GWF1_35_14]OHE38678.1 MAG: hypothetical protein A2Y44_04660 [Tenericutes bacterium GWF2_35_184]OHE44823.1 MAG: hypothetical protein A2221_01235 [Tenericutes bacterium RIFOXYA2_FULL_36_3